MNINYDFKLIDGTFTASEATLILFNLISSKISYHTKENFSSQERFGKGLPDSQKRIIALTEIRDSLKIFLEVAEENNLKLKIEAAVSITLLENQP